MKRQLIDLYKQLFVRKALYRFHQRLFNISLWGMGILNSENDRWSGEGHFLRHLSQYTATRQDLVVFDVGANVGGYARQVKALYPGAKIYAFEPHAENFRLLQQKAGEFGFQAYNLALSNVAGQAQLYDHPGTGTSHASLYREVIEGVHQDNAVQSSVRLTTLDQFTEEHGIAHLHLLKLDTEGSEMNILEGAHRLLESGAVDVIQFEFNEMNVVSRVFFRDFRAYLHQYTLQRMLPDGLVPVNAQPVFVSEIFAFQNIVAIRKDLRPS